MKKFLLILLATLPGFFAVADSGCKNIVFENHFSDPTDWTMVSNSGLTIANNALNFNSVHDGEYHKVYKDLRFFLSNYYWRARCTFSILSPNPQGSGPGDVIMALTAGKLDFLSYDHSNSYRETSEDGIAVVLNSSNPADNNMQNWGFFIESKKGNQRVASFPSEIFADPAVGTYYIQLERTSPGFAQLSIFTDPAFTIPLQGSPLQFAIDPAIKDLNTIQHGVATPGFNARCITAKLSDDLICQEDELQRPGVTSISGNWIQLVAYPNPAVDALILKAEDLPPGIQDYTIYNLRGEQVAKGRMNSGHSLPVSDLAEGMYIFRFTDADLVYWGKFQRMN
jgi:hypothetical protein